MELAKATGAARSSVSRDFAVRGRTVGRAHTGEMGVMGLCGFAVAAALVLAFRWRRCDFAPDPTAAGEPGTTRLGDLARVLAVGSLSGLATGVLFIGPAGRLVMRLLAATSPDAHGRITEADEVVGRITVGGTIGFVLFVGLPAGFAVGMVHPFVARAFPRRSASSTRGVPSGSGPSSNVRHTERDAAGPEARSRRRGASVTRTLRADWRHPLASIRVAETSLMMRRPPRVPPD